LFIVFLLAHEDTKNVLSRVVFQQKNDVFLVFMS
jgi:hypothetical protein